MSLYLQLPLRSSVWSVNRKLSTLLITGFSAVTSAANLAAQTQGNSDLCQPANGAAFVCGVRNVEDVAALYPSAWIVGSNTRDPLKASDVLYLLDASKRTREIVAPSSITVRADRTRFPGCPGAPNFAQFQTYGLGYQATSNDSGTLLVINHGGRDTVEVFDIGHVTTHPQLTWVGCIPEAPHTFGDAVVELPDAGVVVTSTSDPDDKQFTAKVLAGKPVGSVLEWHANTGWKAVPGTENFSFPNGVVSSADGKILYIAVSGTSQIMKVDRSRGKVIGVSVPFTSSAVDNVRWSPDQTLIFAGGEVGTFKNILACSPPKAPACQVGAAVYAMDPETLQYAVILPPAMYGSFGMATGAVLEDKTLWISSAHSDRVALYPLRISTGQIRQIIKSKTSY